MATLAAIERDGLEALTVRAIAREAGVNIAAVNYYFRSKDDLVALVLERSLDRGVKDPLVDFDRLIASGKDARVALAGAIEGVLATAVAFPRTTLAHLHGPVVLQDYRRDVVIRTNALLSRLFARLGKRLAGRGIAGRRATLAQLWSAVTMVSLSPMLHHPFARIDLRDAKQRRAWIAELVDRALLAPVKRRVRPKRARTRAELRIRRARPQKKRRR